MILAMQLQKFNISQKIIHIKTPACGGFDTACFTVLLLTNSFFDCGHHTCSRGH